MSKVIVIGGGASGMMASITSKLNNNEVILLEKNEKLGKKIYITGKGRCNVTNDISPNEFFENVNSNPKFLYSAIYTLSPEKLMSFLEEKGLQLKVERGNRVFPQSDKASDVTKVFESYIKKLGVVINLNTNVEKIIKNQNDEFIIKTNNKDYIADKVIVCTGGISYPLTGSTGDGYVFAKQFNHTIVDTKPALVGLELGGTDFIPLQGLSLKNVSLSIFNQQKLVFSDFGEMLFTHFGISGPIVLSSSCKINRLDLRQLLLSLDLKPALSKEILDNRLLRELDENKSGIISSVVRSLVPKSMVDIILSRTNIKRDKKCAEISHEDRIRLIDTLKNLTFKIKALRPIEEAIITAGGINVKEINPKTMESKIVKGLFFAGEVLDVDCFTGGFNLQVAFSTGYLAGQNT